jgi:hypothetical protein
MPASETLSSGRFDGFQEFLIPVRTCMVIGVKPLGGGR